MKKMVDSSFRT